MTPADDAAVELVMAAIADALGCKTPELWRLEALAAVAALRDAGWLALYDPGPVLPPAFVAHDPDVSQPAEPGDGW